VVHVEVIILSTVIVGLVVAVMAALMANGRPRINRLVSEEKLRIVQKINHTPVAVATDVGSSLREAHLPSPVRRYLEKTGALRDPPQQATESLAHRFQRKLAISSSTLLTT
jgi:hypothetical protein